MKISHLAVWVFDLEKQRHFYEKYFLATSGQKYYNPTRKFTSYFLTFNDDCRLELMQMPGILPKTQHIEDQFSGLTHFAMSVGSKENVDTLTEQLRKDGFRIVGEPRTTGDGYYESVILDPEGNRVEITI